MVVQGQWVGFLDFDDYLLPGTLNQRFAAAIRIRPSEETLGSVDLRLGRGEPEGAWSSA